MMSGEFTGFKPSVIQFLKELNENNNRRWFQANKQRYENEVLFPALNFISAVGIQLPGISEHFTAIPKRIGGSIMRIYRDTRFSKDKTPYKTNIGIQFRHFMAKDVHSPGYYVHIAPNECFIGVGTWHPSSDALLRIRQYIADHPEKWISARDNKAFTNNLKMIGDKLINAPRGFDKDHALIEDLKWKDFIASENFDNNLIQSSEFLDYTISRFKSATPFMKFLCDAVGVAF